MAVAMTMLGHYMCKQSTLSGICNFSANRQHYFLALPISNIIRPLCPRLYYISYLSRRSRAGNSILLFSPLFTSIGGEFKTLKTCSICTKHKSSICLYLILYVSLLVLITVAGVQKRSCLPVVHPEVGSVNSELLSSDFSAGYMLVPWSRMEAWR